MKRSNRVEAVLQTELSRTHSLFKKEWAAAVVVVVVGLLIDTHTVKAILFMVSAHDHHVCVAVRQCVCARESFVLVRVYGNNRLKEIKLWERPVNSFVLLKSVSGFTLYYKSI